MHGGDMGRTWRGADLHLNLPPVQAWKVNLGEQVLDAVANENHLVVISGSGTVCRATFRLTVFGLSDGSELWKHALKCVTPPSIAIYRDTVIVASNDGVTALELDTGHEAWIFDENKRYPSGLFVDTSCAYVIYETGKIYAVDAKTGEPVWVSEPFKGEYTCDAPSAKITSAIVGGIILVGGRNEYVYAIRAKDGTLAWRISLPRRRLSRSAISGAMAISPNGICLQAAQGHSFFWPHDYLVGIRIRDKKVLWVRNLPRTGNRNSQEVITTDGARAVFIRDFPHPEVWCLNVATGRVLWRHKIENVVRSNAPILSGGTIVILRGDGLLTAMDAKRGRTLWNLSLGNQAQHGKEGFVLTSGKSLVVCVEQVIWAFAEQKNDGS